MLRSLASLISVLVVWKNLLLFFLLLQSSFLLPQCSHHSGYPKKIDLLEQSLEK